MKSKRSLMTMLVGLAMLATPITAAAKDHNHDGGKNFSRPAQTRAFNAPSRSFAPARGAARVGTVNEYRGQGAVAHRDWVDANRGWNRGNGYGRPGYYANRGYYNPGYVAAPVAPYYAAPGYAGYGGGYGKSCAHARQIMTVYQQDRYRGHPAAAADVLRQNQWAFHSGCGGAAPMGGGGLFNGFNGFAEPAYNNYGGGYGQPYGGGYNGYNGGTPYPTPTYTASHTAAALAPCFSSSFAKLRDTSRS